MNPRAFRAEQRARASANPRRREDERARKQARRALREAGRDDEAQANLRVQARMREISQAIRRGRKAPPVLTIEQALKDVRARLTIPLDVMGKPRFEPTGKKAVKDSLPMQMFRRLFGWGSQ